jgi:hypothetical protein
MPSSDKPRQVTRASLTKLRDTFASTSSASTTTPEGGICSFKDNEEYPKKFAQLRRSASDLRSLGRFDEAIESYREIYQMTEDCAYSFVSETQSLNQKEQ